MKKLIALCALAVLSGCSNPTNEEIAKHVSLNTREICYDGVIYLQTWVNGGFTLTEKIDKNTLKPINCDDRTSSL